MVSSGSSTLSKCSPLGTSTLPARNSLLMAPLIQVILSGGFQTPLDPITWQIGTLIWGIANIPNGIDMNAP